MQNAALSRPHYDFLAPSAPLSRQAESMRLEILNPSETAPWQRDTFSDSLSSIRNITTRDVEPSRPLHNFLVPSVPPTRQAESIGIGIPGLGRRLAYRHPILSSNTMHLRMLYRMFWLFDDDFLPSIHFSLSSEHPFPEPGWYFLPALAPKVFAPTLTRTRAASFHKLCHHPLPQPHVVILHHSQSQLQQLDEISNSPYCIIATQDMDPSRPSRLSNILDILLFHWITATRDKNPSRDRHDCQPD